MHALKVEGVRKSFRGDMSLARREVLHGVSLHAAEGEALGFLGPNGAGKTTTIKVIVGLIRADAGTVTIFDRSVADRGAMARVGYLPEMPSFYPHLSLREFLELCGGLSGIPRAELPGRIERVVETVGLTPHVARPLKAYSKGMLQRAALAQAILHEPALLVLDEPFSGLDPVGRKMVRDVLIDCKRRGTTIFFSSHVLPDMEALCDRVCIIRGGIMVKSVGLDELLRLGEGNVEVTVRGFRPAMMEEIRGLVESARETGGEAFLVVREQRFVRPVIEHLYRSGAEVLAVSNRRASLEDIFMQEVGRREAAASAPRKERELVRTGS